MTVAGVDVPHDPTHEGGCAAHRERGEACFCNRCETEWPCPIRKEQRRQIQDAVSFLKSDLYERVVPGPMPTGMTWRSPLGWSVFLAYGEVHAEFTITDPSGAAYGGPWHLNSGELDRRLP